MKFCKICIFILALFFIIIECSIKPKEALKMTAQVAVHPIAPTNDKVKKLDSSNAIYDKPLSKHIPITTKKNEYELLFDLPDTGVMQGLTFHDGYFYCSFDLKKGRGKIVKYNLTGNKISETKPMVMGHSAEIAYRASTGKIYVANGGGANPTHVYVIDYNSSTIKADLNYASLGTSALLAIDNIHDYLILHTVANGGDNGRPMFTIINLVDMSTVTTFNIPNQGVPQGLDVDGTYIYLYTDNKVTIFNYDGKIITSYSINKAGESEGLTEATDHGTSYLSMGYNHPNRIYILRSNENRKLHNSQMINKPTRKI